MGIPVRHQVDSFSNIHTLVLLQPKIYVYTIFSPEGKIQQELIYKANFDNIPRLERDTSLGRVKVVNGFKAIEGVDYIRQGSNIRMLR